MTPHELTHLIPTTSPHFTVEEMEHKEINGINRSQGKEVGQKRTALWRKAWTSVSCRLPLNISMCAHAHTHTDIWGVGTWEQGVGETLAFHFWTFWKLNCKVLPTQAAHCSLESSAPLTGSDLSPGPQAPPHTSQPSWGQECQAGPALGRRQLDPTSQATELTSRNQQLRVTLPPNSGVFLICSRLEGRRLPPPSGTKRTPSSLHLISTVSPSCPRRQRLAFHN